MLEPGRLVDITRLPLRGITRAEDTLRVGALVTMEELAAREDPRVAIYLSMLMLEYADTLAPGRARERVGIKALAGLGRLLGLQTDVPA